MLRKSVFASSLLCFALSVACGESDQRTSSEKLASGDGSPDGPAKGGSVGAGGTSNGAGGISKGTGGAKTGAGGISNGAGGASAAGAGTSRDGGSLDGAVLDATAIDASGEAAPPPPVQCMPNGPRSWCTKSSDCCSTSCILNQCTCVPLGYSCSGSGQCCSGYSCQNGTCICPPDIRGC